MNLHVFAYIKILFLALICTIGVETARAEAIAAKRPSVPSMSITPLEKMQDLASMAGDWSMTVSMSNDDGDTWQSSAAQKVSIQFGHNGMMLEETPLDLSGPGFHMHSIITYDQYRRVYRKAAIDDIWGIMDLYEGNIVDGKLVMTNLAAKTFFPIGEHTWRAFRLTIDLALDSRMMWIDKSDDGGETWQKAFKAEYIKFHEQP